MKFFIIAATSPTQEQRNAITLFFQGKPQYGFWHWMPDFWIITTTDHEITARQLLDMIKAAVPSLLSGFGVFAIEPLDWALYSDPKWGEWLDQNWKRSS